MRGITYARAAREYDDATPEDYDSREGLRDLWDASDDWYMRHPDLARERRDADEFSAETRRIFGE